MVVKISVTVKTIQGDSFTVEVDRDADTLGLKVQIWEAKNVDVNNQRLVFDGKELDDSSKLEDLGVSDGSELFLVETASNSQVELPSRHKCERKSNSYLQVYDGEESVSDEIQQTQQNRCKRKRGACRRRCPYANLTDSELRIRQVTKLAFWLRLYCFLGVLFSLVGCFECIGSLLFVVLFALGIIGTRLLNRCLIFLPTLLTMLTGFGGTGFAIYSLAGGKHHHHHHSHHTQSKVYYHNSSSHSSHHCKGMMIAALIVSLFHIIIFLSSCKLLCRISHLTQNEKASAKMKISKSCC